MGRPCMFPVAGVIPEYEYDFGVGYVYAAELTDGTVKIGFTRSPRNRVRTLGIQCRRVFNASVAKFVCSEGMRVRDALAFEGSVLAKYGTTFERAGSRLGEFFRGGDFRAACGLIAEGAPAVPSPTAAE